LLEIRVLRGRRLLITHRILIVGATPVERRVILLINAPTCAPMPISHEQPLQLLLMVPILALLLPGSSMLEEALATILDMFLINATTAIVLFDFGALHFFISVHIPA
jgi:hypothetical protein